MVMEIKIISLSNSELKSAVMRQLLRGDEQGREFHIKDLKVHDTPPISADVTLERVSGRVEEKNLDHGFLAAAILRFCMDNKIPLPRSATKNLQVVNGLLSMFLSMETTDVR
ncbi:MAG: hypothetical protein H6868_05645 [Rhodospirillales bacterium]|nr:hypothetical protein [Rhodospirillales bacterium]